MPPTRAGLCVASLLVFLAAGGLVSQHFDSFAHYFDFLGLDDPLRVCKSKGFASVETLDDIALCMASLVVPENSISPGSYYDEANMYVPTDEQRRDLGAVVRRLASSPSPKLCRKVILPSSLRRIYRPPALFTDTGLGEEVCLLLERAARGRGRFVAGWAWLAVRPHPAADDPDSEQQQQQQLLAAEERRQRQRVQEQEQVGGQELQQLQQEQEPRRRRRRRAVSLPEAAAAEPGLLQSRDQQERPGAEEEGEEEGEEALGLGRGEDRAGALLGSGEAAEQVAAGCRDGDGTEAAAAAGAAPGEAATAEAATAEASGIAGEGKGVFGRERGATNAVAGRAAGRRPSGAGAWWGLPRLHLGAPHPNFEGPVDLQAVALFRRLPGLARSVVVAGKHRRAAAGEDSRCLPGLGYPASDPSHNADDAFNAVSVALLRLEAEEAQEEDEEVGVEEQGHGQGQGQAAAAGTAAGAEDDGRGGGRAAAGPPWDPQPGPASDPGGRQPPPPPPPRVMFLQLHGKAAASCPASTVFASGGFGRNASAFYGRAHTAVAALARALTRAAASGTAAVVAAEAVADEAETVVAEGREQGLGWAVHLPPDDPACPLAATRNVFGRVVNGVPRRECCDRSPDEGGPVAAAEEGLAGRAALLVGVSGGGASSCGLGAAATGGVWGGGRGDRASRSCFGAFVHVEQAAEARDPAAWGVWAEALREAVSEGA